MSDNPYTDERREFLSWLEEYADLAGNEPPTEQEREKASERALELADKVLSTYERNLPKPEIADLLADEAEMRAAGFQRAADGLHYLIEQWKFEWPLKASEN